MLAEPLPDARKLSGQAFLELLEIGAPACELFLNTTLCFVERLCELCRGVALALCDIAAASSVMRRSSSTRLDSDSERASVEGALEIHGPLARSRGR